MSAFNLFSYVVFGFVLLAYTLQTELAQNIQKTYAQSYLLFYLTHSAYTFTFPIVLLILRPKRPLLLALRRTIYAQFSHSYDDRKGYQTIASDESCDELDFGVHTIEHAELWDWEGFPFGKLALVASFLAILVAIPGGTWYYAIHLTTATDISAIYNSNCIFAFIFSRLLFRSHPNSHATTSSRIELLSVVLASIGVLIIAYGSSSSETEEANQRLLGNLLTLLGSASFGFYEVIYSTFISPVSVISSSGKAHSKELLVLHTAFLTTLIGVSSLLILSIPFLFLPTPSSPPSTLIPNISLMVLSGVSFNALFIILISLWGPVTASIGNLGTLLTVAITDWSLGGTLGLETWLGGFCVALAFGGLAWDQGRNDEVKRVFDLDAEELGDSESLDLVNDR